MKGIVADTDIANDATIADLEVDSLAAVELAEDLLSTFGQEVDATELLSMTYEELAKLCHVSAQAKAAKTSLPTVNTQNSVSASKTAPKSQDSKDKQKSFTLLSENAGTPVPSIMEGSTF